VKEEVLKLLSEVEARLRTLRGAVQAIPSPRVSRRSIREEAAEIADIWVEKLRSPLEYRFHLPKETVEEFAQAFKRLHVLSRPNNLKTSYIETLRGMLRGFKDRLVLPVQQFSEPTDQVFDLLNVVKGLPDPEESDYLREAVECAARGYRRAAVVMGWCAAIDRIQRKIRELGFDRFNQASSMMKAQTSGRFKAWNKEFKVTSLSELQQVFDADAIWVLEGLCLLDSNQGDRLRNVCYLYRNQSAHPGQAKIEDAHLVAFFTDLNSIVFANASFALR
jgi:hypothetical protein